MRDRVAVEGHELVRDERVRHAHVVLGALQQPAPGRGHDLVPGRGEEALQHRVALAQRAEKAVGAPDGRARVGGPLRGVGLPWRGVDLQVAEALALAAQARRAGGRLRHAFGRRWRRGAGDVRKARGRPAPRVEDAAHEEARGALLRDGAHHGVRADVEAVVAEAGQRDAVLRVLRAPHARAGLLGECARD